MKYENLVRGKLLKRYKRFLADIILENGEEVTAHCPNSGSMKSCIVEGAEVCCSPVKDPKRKTRFTWEMICIDYGWVGINTGIPNQVAAEWIGQGKIETLAGYDEIKREVTWEDSRFDIQLRRGEEECFVEVKNVTLKEGVKALFPDSVTSRGKKHLEALMRLKKQGTRAVMLYFVQRMDVQTFSPARDIDPEYASALDKAVQEGVEVVVVQARVSPDAIEFAGLLEYIP